MSALEHEIFNRIRHGDLKAFDLLFHSYYPPLCLFAGDIVKDVSVAEEIVSDVFVKLWQMRQSIDITVSYKAYLYKMVRNHCLNYLRDSKAHYKINPGYYNDLGNFHDLVLTSGEQLLDGLLNEEIEKDLEQALNSLSPQCREIFLLCRMEGMTYRKVAEKLNLSVSTVKTQMLRAMDKLVMVMEKYL